MTLVVDASMVVAALVDSGSSGIWAEALLARENLAAPHLMPVEVANILRRSALFGDITSDIAALAHNDLLDLQVELFPYHPFAERVWQLRENFTAYDACYIALAEMLDAPLATLDHKLVRSDGSCCTFVTPPNPELH